MSRVNGRASLGEIAKATAVDPLVVLNLMDRLERLGFVRCVAPGTPAVASVLPPPPGATPHVQGTRSVPPIPQPGLPPPMAPPRAPQASSASVAPPPPRMAVGMSQPPPVAVSDRPISGAQPAVRVPPPPPPPSVPNVQAPPAAPSAPATPARAQPLIPRGRFAPSELAETAELDDAQKKRVLDLYAALSDCDYYMLFGLPRDADKKTVKRAYYDVAMNVHPDKFFRKNLGSFKAKMEAIFTRLTEAHDVLTDKARREEYDAYLKSVANTQGLEQLFARAMADMERAKQAALQEVQAAANRPSMAPPPPPAAPEKPATPFVPKAAATAAEMQARREALARRLLGGQAARPSMPPPAAAAAGPAQHPLAGMQQKDAMDALKRRYEERVTVAKDVHLRKQVVTGEEALAKGDFLAAANAFRIASSIDPDDADIRQRADEAQARANEDLAVGYEKQASYEERGEHWAEAGRSWNRVAQLRPTQARAHERAAYCMVRAEGNMHDAAELGKRAVTLEPQVAQNHLTLGMVYQAAGLPLAAKREAELALGLAPDNPNVQAFHKKLGK